MAGCGWLHREQTDLIASLREENRVLKARLGGQRLRFEDDERRRLGELGHRLGRRLLAQVATVVTPEFWDSTRMVSRGSSTIFESEIREASKGQAIPRMVCLSLNLAALPRRIRLFLVGRRRVLRLQSVFHSWVLAQRTARSRVGPALASNISLIVTLGN